MSPIGASSWNNGLQLFPESQGIPCSLCSRGGHAAEIRCKIHTSAPSTCLLICTTSWTPSRTQHVRQPCMRGILARQCKRLLYTCKHLRLLPTSQRKVEGKDTPESLLRPRPGRNYRQEHSRLFAEGDQQLPMFGSHDRSVL